MARTGIAAAINARLVPAVEYGPDPRGWGFFNRLSAVIQRGNAGREGTRVLDLQYRFTGLLDSPQQMTGMAPLGLAAPVVPSTSELGDERAAGPLNDMALRIFAERLRRGNR